MEKFTLLSQTGNLQIAIVSINTKIKEAVSHRTFTAGNRGQASIYRLWLSSSKVRILKKEEKMAEGVFATFFSGRDGGVIARIEGKVSFPERGWTPKAGETYEVEIVGQSKSGKAQFLRRIAGPFYAVEGEQRQYGWYVTTALGEPDVEFQSGFSGGSAYYTAVWTGYSYAEALRRYQAVKAADEEEKASKARMLAEAKVVETERLSSGPMRALLSSWDEEIALFVERCTRESGQKCVASIDFKLGRVEITAVYKHDPNQIWDHFNLYLEEGGDHLMTLEEKNSSVS